MNRTPLLSGIRGLLVCAVLVGVLASLPLPASAQTYRFSARADSLIDPFLKDVVVSMKQERKTRSLPELAQLKKKQHVTVDDEGRVLIEVFPQSGRVSPVVAKLNGLGGKSAQWTEEHVYCMVPFDSIEVLAESPDIRYISHGPSRVVRAGSVPGDGDSPLFADKARDLFTADGSDINGVPVVVGVISDGAQDRQASQTSQDLPAGVGMADYYSDTCSGTEGTAMLEIVHDLAPGAALWFGSSGLTPLNMRDRINSLASHGCRVIVDDIGWNAGIPFFQDFDITAAIDQFTANGGTYVSSAGNDEKEFWVGTPNLSYGRTKNWLTFPPNGDTALSYQITEQSNLFVVLQWAEQWTYSSTDLDLYLKDINGTVIGYAHAHPPGVHPEEVINLGSVAAGSYKVLVEWYNYQGGGSVPYLGILATALNAGGIHTGAWAATSTNHIYGHTAGANTISVAACPVTDLSHLENFSSKGKSRMIPAGLNSLVDRNTPTITAVDGVHTAVGQRGHFENPFFGTSASAPHAAAVAALYFSRYPSRTNANFLSDMKNSGRTIGSYGAGGQYNASTGWGMISAYDAIVNGLTVLTSPQVTTNTNWSLVRVTGIATIASGKVVTIPAKTTSIVEGSVTFGDAGALISVAGTLILGPSASVDPSHLQVTGNGRLIGGNFVGVTVNQLDEQLAPFDSVGRWRSNAFEKHLAPYSFTTAGNSQETFRSKQDFKISTTQKYNKWDVSTSVLNHQSFLVDSSHSTFKALFKTSQNASAQAQLIDSALTGGSINVRDPWQINLNDAPYGWRNRGTAAIDTPVSSGQSNLGVNTNFHGVFLNQDYNLPGGPYYSVGAPSQQTISGYSSFFQYWSGTNVAFQSPNASQTGVVFQQSGATATALYKAHLVSKSTTATSGNMQRKIIRDNANVYYMVYEAGGCVYTARSTDGGTTWLGEQMVNTPDPAWTARNPSLGLMSGPFMVGIVYEYRRTDNSEYFIMFRSIDPSTGALGEEHEIDYDAPAGSAARMPVLSGDGDGWFFAAWYDPVNHVMKGAERDGDGWWDVAPLRSGTISGVTTPPSIGSGVDNWQLLWLQGGNLHYAPIPVGQLPVLGTTPDSIVAYGGDDNTLNNQSAVALPRTSGCPAVAWEEYRMTSPPQRITKFREHSDQSG